MVLVPSFEKSCASTLNLPSGYRLEPKVGWKEGPLHLTVVFSASPWLPSDQLLHSAPLQGDRQNKVLENVWKASWEFGVFKCLGKVCRGVRKVVPGARLT